MSYYLFKTTTNVSHKLLDVTQKLIWLTINYFLVKTFSGSNRRTL